MTKEDKQLKKEFDKEFLDIKRLDCGRLTTYKKEFKKEKPKKKFKPTPSGNRMQFSPEMIQKIKNSEEEK
jgi:hypothetical protein